MPSHILHLFARAIFYRVLCLFTFSIIFWQNPHIDFARIKSIDKASRTHKNPRTIFYYATPHTFYLKLPRHIYPLFARAILPHTPPHTHTKTDPHKDAGKILGVFLLISFCL
ncbi:hypothetical protein [Helicobacter sp. T3_23-1056]